jgi:hypothetical protein
MRSLVLAVCFVCAVGSSAAADTPPTPTPITKKLFRELVRGEHPLVEWIDPTAGVVVDDRQLCGDDIGAGLPVAMFELQRGLGWAWSPAPLTCTNRPTPSCTLGTTDAIRIDFRHDAGGRLVIDAIAHMPGRAVRRKTCSAPVAAVATRPTKVTKRFFRELGWGLRPISDVIDPRHGLVRASWPNSGAEEDHTPAPRHLCGAAVDLEELRRGLLWLAAQEESGYFGCRNTPQHECSGSELVDEYSNHHHVVFIDDPDRGLVLESWIDLDEGLTSPESQREQRRWAKRLVEDARAHPCEP